MDQSDTDGEKCSIDLISTTLTEGFPRVKTYGSTKQKKKYVTIYCTHIYLSTCISIILSIYLFIYLSIYLSTSYTDQLPKCMTL